jgi:hypothetical protein
MDGRELVPVTDVRVVRSARQEAVVAGGDEAVRVLAGGDDDATDVQAFASWSGN